MLIAVLNQSTLVTDPVATMSRAIAKQVGLMPLRCGTAPRRGHVLQRADQPCRPTAHGITVVDTIQDRPRACSASTPRTRAGGCGAWSRPSPSSTTTDR